MKLYFFSVIPFVLFLNSCFFYTGISGSGRLITKDYYLSGFYTVNASGASLVTVTEADYYSVTLICDDNIINYLNVFSDGYTLYTEVLSGYSLVDYTFTVNITMPDISAVEVKEASDIQVSGFTLADNFNISLSESSVAHVFLTDATSVRGNVDEASYLEIKTVYPVESLDLSCTGASTADLKGMLCRSGEISVHDASSLWINMDGSLIGQVSGASILYFRGSPAPGPILFSGASGIIYY